MNKQESNLVKITLCYNARFIKELDLEKHLLYTNFKLRSNLNCSAKNNRIKPFKYFINKTCLT